MFISALLTLETILRADETRGGVRSFFSCGLRYVSKPFGPMPAYTHHYYSIIWIAQWMLKIPRAPNGCCLTRCACGHGTRRSGGETGLLGAETTERLQADRLVLNVGKTAFLRRGIGVPSLLRRTIPWLAHKARLCVVRPAGKAPSPPGDSRRKANICGKGQGCHMPPGSAEDRCRPNLASVGGRTMVELRGAAAGTPTLV